MTCKHCELPFLRSMSVPQPSYLTKKEIVVRVSLGVGVKCVPCSEYLHVLSWLNRETRAWLSPPLRMQSIAYNPLYASRPALAALPPLGWSSENVTSSWIWVSPRQHGLITEGVRRSLPLHIQRDTEGHYQTPPPDSSANVWWSRDPGCQVGCSVATSPDNQVAAKILLTELDPNSEHWAVLH